TLHGDLSAFDSLVRRHQGRATAIAVRYSKNASVAPDIVATAFAKAYVAMPKFRGQCRFTTWLHRIVVNTAYDVNERQLKTETVSFDDARLNLPMTDRFGHPQAAGAVEDFSVDGEACAREELISAFRRLPKQDQELLLLRLDQEMPYETLALRFGIALGTVKSRLHRARKHLKLKLPTVA
nr:sigma-70 family RNA polymerase sigma factor [Fimbriimonadaceae bacterium]